MKKIFLPIATALLLMIVVASTTFAAPAVSEKELLLKGSFQAVETQQVFFPTVFANGTGSGNATQLGLFTYGYEVVVNLPTGQGQGSSHLVAANGDIIFAEGWGQSAPTETPNVISIVEEWTITGGTGRFAGANGNWTVQRLLNRATGLTSGSISGTIVLP